ncbi:LacI family DNA-binding transcriptional regulator [Micromonospora maritima]|uniref:LacI family DNA-binding transcriptional regulator n=1 Tax=Micromonospora maritima TaxID=986711 RepID=UPI00157C0595|nr:LacI family DNA-binding transcriptional regulator [Micromonospora maritima]
MRDVARLAGVSHQTVSRVLNGLPNVSDSVRERVERAVAQLGYRPNVSARALITKRTMTLGVVSVSTQQYGPAGTLTGISEAARRAGYFVSVTVLDAVDRQSMRSAIDHLLAAAVDGVIVIAPVGSVVEAVAGVARTVPLVMVEARDGEQSVAGIDQVGGARTATRHLLDLGHRTVAHVRGPINWFEADARVSGWLTELMAAHAPVPEVLVGDWSPRSGYEAGRRILERSDVTAVFAANDQMALGLLRAFEEAGRSVPGDISVVGFDDLPESEFFHPPLTTVRQDFAEVGRRCIAEIVARIDGTSPPSAGLIVPEMVVRDSTAAPR